MEAAESDWIYSLHVDGKEIALLYDPVFSDMFWCEYRLVPVSAAADEILRDPETWENVNFVIKDRQGATRRPSTFSGGYREFCARESDLLTFRSLWPPQWLAPVRWYHKALYRWVAMNAWWARRWNSLANKRRED